MIKNFLLLIVISTCQWAIAQEEVLLEYNNQVSSNLSYATVGTIDFSYERTLSKKLAVGIGYTSYGKAHQDLELESSDLYWDFVVNFEINPFARLYFQGTQKRSLFIELFGSYNEGEAKEGVVRSTNSLGYGVYNFGTRKISNIGIGTGLGYRFLLLNNRLALEAQIGIRKNFEELEFYNLGLVRTGIKVGYRF